MRSDAIVKPPPVFDPKAPGFWTPGAAWYLSRAQVTLRRWRCTGAGPEYRLVNGRAWYDRATLDAFLAGHRTWRSTSEQAAAMAGAA